MSTSTSCLIRGRVIRGTFDKRIVIKAAKPKPNEATQPDLIAIERLRWEKEVLTNLRGASSPYLPKYYHTVQEHHECRQALLMDFLPGPTLHERLARSPTLSAVTRLTYAEHLSAALLFLQEYDIAHLDLTPANVIIHGGVPRLVDFGEAYCPRTARKYHSRHQPCHVPGRSFPFCPPETTLRSEGFTSAQDIYSLGVILLQMWFRYQFPSKLEL